MTGRHPQNKGRLLAVRPTLRRLSRLLSLSGVAFCLVLTGVPLPTDWLHHGFPVATALADDDDDNGAENDGGGDDDSGGGDGGGGGGDDDEGGAGGDDDNGSSGGDDDEGDDPTGSLDDPTGSLEAPGSKVRPAQSREGYGTAREILAIDADAATISSLEAAGFVAQERRILSSLGVTISRLTIPPSLGLSAAMARARQVAPRISYEANPVYRIADDGQEIGRIENTQCAGSDCYSFDLVGWPSNPEYCGNGLRIGIADTAIDLDHPALRNQLVRRRQFAPVGPDRRSPIDHGTAVAALLVGDPSSGYSGMLPAASLFAADVFHLDRRGQPQATLTDLVHGLDWLAGQQVSVINISMTGPPNRLLETAIQILDGRGIGLVAAAGNGGPTAAPAFPAAYDNVVSVTAIGQDLRAYRLANRGDYIAFASPGVGIWSAADGGGGRYRTGTSVAAVLVSAAIAEIIGDDNANLGRALTTLRRDALDLGAPGRDPVFGWGLIQATPSCRG